MNDSDDDLIIKFIDDISQGFFVSPIKSVQKIDEIEELFYDEFMGRLIDFRNQLIINKDNEVAVIKHELDVCLLDKNFLGAEIIKIKSKGSTKKILIDKTVGLIGGTPNRVLKLKGFLSENFSCSSFKETSPDSSLGLSDFSNKYKKCHLLIVNTDYIGHDLSGLAKKVSDSYHIPMIEYNNDFFNHVGLKVIELFDN